MSTDPNKALITTQQGYSNAFPAAPSASALKSLIDTNAIGISANALAIGANTLAIGALEDAAYGVIADPGDAGAIPVAASGGLYITSTEAGGETRTLADPTLNGQTLDITLDVDGGTVVITAASAINATGNNTITLADAGDFIRLTAVQIGGDLVWRVVANYGAALSTVT